MEVILSHQGVIAANYKPYAFLCHPEYVEQLLSHLLSLSTVDVAAFTVNYIPAVIIYKVRIVTEKGFRAGTSANVCINIKGDHEETGLLERGKAQSFAGGASHVFEISHKNLGPLQYVELGHDGSGMNASWTVD